MTRCEVDVVMRVFYLHEAEERYGKGSRTEWNKWNERRMRSWLLEAVVYSEIKLKGEFLLRGVYHRLN
jgi:hypothetical protein